MDEDILRVEAMRAPRAAKTYPAREVSVETEISVRRKAALTLTYRIGGATSIRSSKRGSNWEWLKTTHARIFSPRGYFSDDR